MYLFLDFVESLTSGIEDPRISSGALHASVQSSDLSWQFSVHDTKKKKTIQKALISFLTCDLASTLKVFI